MAGTTDPRATEISEGYRRRKVGDHDRIIRKRLRAAQGIRYRSEKFQGLAASDCREPAAPRSPGPCRAPGVFSIEIWQQAI
jgi:hypothetical protein